MKKTKNAKSERHRIAEPESCTIQLTCVDHYLKKSLNSGAWIVIKWSLVVG